MTATPKVGDLCEVTMHVSQELTKGTHVIYLGPTIHRNLVHKVVKEMSVLYVPAAVLDCLAPLSEPDCRGVFPAGSEIEFKEGFWTESDSPGRDRNFHVPGTRASYLGQSLGSGIVTQHRLLVEGSAHTCRYICSSDVLFRQVSVITGSGQ